MSQVKNICGTEYLADNFAPIGDEIEVGKLKVTGAIPSALSGLYLRNGPKLSRW